MNPETLKDELIKRIDDYLHGKTSEEEAAEWALDIIKKYPYDSNTSSALNALMLLDEPERFRTAKEDLIKEKDILIGKKSS
jgi:hypothetical protein